MWLTWISDELCWDAMPPQGSMEGDSLTQGYASILLAMENQYRRFDVASEGNRTEFQVSSVLFAIPRRAATQLLLKIWQVAGQNHHAPVAHACAHDSRFKTLCLRDRPGGHKSSLTPAANAKFFRVGNTALDGCIYSGHDVLVISHANRSSCSCRKLLSMSKATTGIRHQDRVPRQGQPLPPVETMQIEAMPPSAIWSTVDKHDHRQRLAFCRIGWSDQEAIQF